MASLCAMGSHQVQPLGAEAAAQHWDQEWKGEGSAGGDTQRPQGARAESCSGHRPAGFHVPWTLLAPRHLGTARCCEGMPQKHPEEKPGRVGTVSLGRGRGEDTGDQGGAAQGRWALPGDSQVHSGHKQARPSEPPALIRDVSPGTAEGPWELRTALDASLPPADRSRRAGESRPTP